MSKFQTISTGVFDRSGRGNVSPQTFYGALASSLIWGLFATSLVAYFANGAGFVPNIWHILILGLVVPLAGCYVAIKSDNPIVSFLGYNMLVVPFGFVLAPILQQYSPDVITHAFGMTAVVTFVMGLAGTLFPNFFSKLGPALSLSLFGLILILFASMFIPGLNLGVIDYIGAGIFSLYIGYDMYRANHVEKTIDNAIDISLQLYLDIVNLFLYLLSIASNDD